MEIMLMLTVLTLVVVGAAVFADRTPGDVGRHSRGRTVSEIRRRIANEVARTCVPVDRRWS